MPFGNPEFESHEPAFRRKASIDKKISPILQQLFYDTEFLYAYTQTFKGGFSCHPKEFARFERTLQLIFPKQYLFAFYTSPTMTVHVHGLIKLHSTTDRVTLKAQMHHEYGFADLRPIKSFTQEWVSKSKKRTKVNTFNKWLLYIMNTPGNEILSPYYIMDSTFCSQCNTIHQDDGNLKTKTIELLKKLK